MHRRLARETRNEAGIYDMRLCDRCGLTFAAPMVAPTSAWYELAYRALEVKPVERWEFDVVLRTLRPGDGVYEIGCGLGQFLRSCRERGVEAVGIDFSPRSVEACGAEGFHAEVVDIGNLHGKPSRPAAVIVCFQVLEHLQRPDDLFRHAREVAAEDAVLWVSVPSDRSVSRVLSLPEAFDDPPHHLTKWTAEAFEAIGARHGWRLDRLAFQPFSWRSALWSVASHFPAYRRLREAGWTRRRATERAIRLLLYPLALVRLCLAADRRRMTGISMLASFRPGSGRSDDSVA